ncbi:helix-turn-helix domain-containing protein [Chthonobacter rhizosphaerae]|uniref:helix-turn-helix domain-containing protein n=1 Tax=Chthonobacter rhizosphaerae TaxID=2735553 RepID=UPI0015EF4961|nr:helix-turn-helix domain-containing protein [Chthonobacter rhizosphaerae]
MSRHCTHSTALKRQAAQEYLAGETLHALGKRHDLSRNLIRIWLEMHQAGALDEEAVAADVGQEYETRTAPLERLVGKQAMELELLKKALKNAPRARSGSTSVITGPTISPSQTDAN